MRDSDRRAFEPGVTSPRARRELLGVLALLCIVSPARVPASSAPSAPGAALSGPSLPAASPRARSAALTGETDDQATSGEAPRETTVRDRPPVTVRVEGVGGAARRNVRSHLSILSLQSSEGALERRVERLHREAEEEIRRALEPLGFYRPRVDAELRREGPSRWRAVYRIDPGPPVRLERVEVEITGDGARDALLRRVVSRSSVREGAPLQHPAYEGLKSRLMGAALSRGYLDAAYRESRVEVDLERYRAEVRIQLATGPRHRLGPVRFVEDGTFSSSFYRKLVPFEAGAPYSLARLLEFRELMVASGYFQRVEVDAPPEAADGLTVPIVARLEARPRSVLSLGGGLSTDRGPRVSGEWQVRRLGPEGDRFRAEVRAALFRQSAAVSYAVPVGMPGHDELVVAAGARREEFEEVTTRTVHGLVGLTHRRGRWREAAQLRLEREWSEVGGTGTDQTFLLPQISWSRNSRDEALQPTRGQRVSLEVRGSPAVLGSRTSFLQLLLQGKLIRSPLPDGRLLVRASAGFSAVNEAAALPPSLRFFAGGDESVRGYEYNTLAPRGPGGELVGGRHLVAGSLELDHRVVGPFGLAVFLDAGAATDDLPAPGDLATGAGAGLRWRSPVGPVRLDLAFALDEPGTPARLHLVVGPDL